MKGVTARRLTTLILQSCLVKQMVSSISMIVSPHTLRRAVNLLNDCALAKETVRFDELFVGSPMIVKSCWTLGQRLGAERGVQKRTPQNSERPFVSGPPSPYSGAVF